MKLGEFSVFSLENIDFLRTNELEENLSKYKIVKPTAGQKESSGFLSIQEDFGILENTDIVKYYTHKTNNSYWFIFGYYKKIVPNSIIKEEYNKKLEELLKNNVKVKSQEKKDLKESITSNLYARAFAVLSKTFGYIDLENKRLVIFTKSAKNLDNITTNLRKAIGSLPAKNLENSNLVVWLNEILKNNQAPKMFSFDNSGEIKEEIGGSLIKFAKQNFDKVFIEKSFSEGKSTMKLGLTFDDAISFVISKDFKFSGLKLVNQKNDYGNLSSEADKNNKNNTVKIDKFAKADSDRFLYYLETAKLLNHFVKIIN